MPVDRADAHPGPLRHVLERDVEASITYQFARRVEQPRAATLGDLQTQLDTFAAYYNTVRPHRALGRRTPASAYAARPKATPNAAALTVPPHHRIRQDKIDTSGVVTLRHNSRLHHIGLGRRHAGTIVRLLIKDLRVRVITEDGQLLRELDLDPTRDYQPQA